MGVGILTDWLYGLIMLGSLGIVICLIIYSASQKIADQSQTYEESQVIIKTYEGNQAEAMRRFQFDVSEMAAQGYFPTSQSWTPGQWSGGAFAVAILLIFLFGLGILILAYMLIVKPDGVLTVTYERRAVPVEEKTCPKCAERIKAAALVCHFCGYEFRPEALAAQRTKEKGPWG
jgi:predicted Zn-ribbon and HTH transcriptional regulator